MTNSAPTPITIARGDGIGPEIMDATLEILQASGANLAFEEIQIGESVYKRGIMNGMEPSAWDSLRRTKVFLKAPITTPQGGGYKSLNVTIRGALGLFANIRPCVSYHPYVATKHPTMDVVIVRENEEDLYAGIEYRQSQEVTQAVKLITRPGSEKIIRYAFEYARANHRRKVTAFVKDNIMKISDGLFHRVFDEIAAEYPEIEHETMIVDIGAARLADTPEHFDVIVTLNLYGDIISDIAAQITGSVGLAGSSNIGDQCAMFEAIHGSAPTIAGKGIANPSGLILASVMMLVHIGQAEAAEKIHNAWLKMIEDGIHTVDIFKRGVSKARVGTRDFALNLIDRLGERPTHLTPASYQVDEKASFGGIALKDVPRQEKKLLGVDVFVDHKGGNGDDMAARVAPLAGDVLKLTMISNRGQKVWPEGAPETFCTDHWRLRLQGADGKTVTHGDIIALLGRLDQAGLDVVQTASLYSFDGANGFSVAAGQ
ncbi:MULTISPECIES: NADP-dependent isocitrate dehydrogenase [Azospirillaceae]|jgi:isocitrate dehydrogenase|uniref:NADP-dependent isocitrate dehydrogenase n=1 Tax=Azospirillaceae TaxID=2829815 RepID=UPI000B6B26D8|nr:MULTISPECIES: NADP-dependent isocitrate dehydrogenase [Azospirillaceae]MDG5494016.1 NADP-dependent isocitrate dehydrogenase [Niveispirillum sp. BGYR6]SNS76527.1 isocitrate dehydrogenase [Azospirillum sp. RU38E]SNS93724.1 isocitrate dehydrogenase [Azospirillum sp. RU37A]